MTPFTLRSPASTRFADPVTLITDAPDFIAHTARRQQTHARRVYWRQISTFHDHLFVPMVSYRQFLRRHSSMNPSDHDTSPSNKLPALDQFGFHQRLSETGGTALIMFSSPDCGSCRHLRRVLRQVHARKPLWHLFEVDVQRDAGLANEFEVFHLPTIFLFQDGEYHCRLETEARTEAIVAATLAALGRPAMEAP